MPKFSELPVATTVGVNDIVPLVQNAVSMRTTVGAIRGSGSTTTPPTGTAANLAGAQLLDSFSGTSDDDKLSSALSYVGSLTSTTKPAIIPSSRQYSFSIGGRVPPNGWKLVNPFGYGNQQRGANSIPVDMRYTGTGTWWTGASGNTFDVEFGGIGFQGNSGATFYDSNPGVLWTSKFHDLGFNLWKHVWGSPSLKFLNTAIEISGWMNINNSYGCAFTFGGSDSNLFLNGCLLDSPQSISTNMGAEYHARFDFQEKTSVGPMFITADRVSGIYITGNATNMALVFYGQGRCEGRNAATPCYGSNIRIDGGAATFRDWEISYGATALNTTSHTGEGGVITITGGNVMFDGCWYDRANGVAESVPFIYQTGGFVRVRNQMAGAKVNAWSTVPGKPRVQTVGGVLDADSSVVVS